MHKFPAKIHDGARRIATSVAFLASYAKSQPNLKHLAEDRFMLVRMAVEIWARRRNVRTIVLPLYSIRPLHRLERVAARQKLQQRIDALAPHRQALAPSGVIRADVVRQYAPSITPIRVLRLNDGSFFAHEGNGRIFALQAIFPASEAVRLEVEESVLEDADKFIDRIDHYLRDRGF